MSNEIYRVDLQKEQLTFSAAHFITFAGNICERLHGHNYGVKCEVVGELDENGYVVDFIALRDALQEITKSLDHHVLLPTEHQAIKVQTEGDEVIARFESKRWVFPAEDCVLLPIANTTAELLAHYIGQQMIEQSNGWRSSTIQQIVISVDENQGQWGSCQLQV